jgi:hypothetical protein
MRVEITPALLSDLRQKAEAAGGEEWLQGIVYEVIRSIDKRKVVNDINLLPFYKDHIAAASPAVVLALVAEVERLRNRLVTLECSSCGDLRNCCMCDEHPEASQ